MKLESVKPEFLIIGERRSGTTALSKWLRSHPEIYLHEVDDTGFFLDKRLVGSRPNAIGKVDLDDWEKDRNVEEYKELFSNTGSKVISGEKSADYLFWNPSHKRIKKYLPNVKLLVCLRNPVKRAYSMYWNELGKGRESKSFYHAITNEEDRIVNNDYALDHLSYKSRGNYYKSLKKLFETFDRIQVHVVILEKLISNSEVELKEVCEFLNIDSSFTINNAFRKVNSNWTLLQKPFIKKISILSKVEDLYYKLIRKMAKWIFANNVPRQRETIKLLTRLSRFSKSDIRMSKKSLIYLQNYYREDISSLENMLSEDLSMWYKV